MIDFLFYVGSLAPLVGAWLSAARGGGVQILELERGSIGGAL